MSNLLKLMYERFWVPLMGRMLSLFISGIEGKPPKKKPSYKFPKEGSNEK